MGQWMDGFLDRLDQNRKENLEGGGADRIGIQHDLDKLTARERIECLVDSGSFAELGSLVRDPRTVAGELNKPSPSDGVIMGTAEIDGRRIMVYATDFTIMSGAIGDEGVWKIAELVEMAGRQKTPIIGMFDSVGSRVGFSKGFYGLNGLARLTRNYCLYSGIIPQIALVLGPCTGPLAHIPVLSDFLIMNENTGFLWYGGEIESEEAGDADFHMRKSGQVDLAAESDEEAMDLARKLLTFMPSSCWEKPPRIQPTDDPERTEEALLDVMPDNVKFTYDIHEILGLIVDDGEFFEIKEDYAPNLVVGMARFDGMPAGIVASNPDELSGIMEPNSSDKYDRFMMFLDNFNIPMINFSDTTAYPPGDRWERLGVIRHGAKNLHGYSNTTNPKVTIVLRRSYGGSNLTMGCTRMGPDYIYAWPTAEFAPTGPEAIVLAVFHKDLEKARQDGNYDEVYNFFLGVLREQFSVLTMGKGYGHYYTVQEVIDPRDTRTRIIKALRAAVDKSEQTLERRRYIKPA